MSYDFDQQPPGLSSGVKVAIGCGAMAFLGVALLCGGIVFFGFRLVDKAQEVAREVIQEMEQQLDAFAVRFEAEGYQRVTGQVVDVSADVHQPTVYTVQVFKLSANSTASLAVMAQVAEINGTIDGDLHFYGQSLTIHPEAVITGNLYVEMAQMLDNRGTVAGEVIHSETKPPGMLNEGESSPVPEPLSDPSTDSSTAPATEPGLKPPPGDVIRDEESATEAPSTPADAPTE